MQYNIIYYNVGKASADVELVSPDGRVQAHALLLAQASEYM